jgi:D-alanyl-D-alanine carboxypeptidase (penicillin-binding protein 5/6)
VQDPRQGRLSGRRSKRWRLWLAALAALALLPAGTARADAPPKPPTLSAREWILLDADDHARLAGHDVTTSRAMASTTKLMTAYLALHQLPLAKLLTAPPYSPIPGESLLGLRAGERMSVRDLLYGLLLPSGNDAAVALADGVAGSVPAFVDEMNAAARRLGLEDTHYANPIGLDEAGNYSSAADLVTLAEKLRRDPTFRRIVDTPEKTVTSGSRTIHLENTNTLLRDYDWVNGVKTGHTLEAGNVLIGSAKQHGVTLVSAVLGAPTETARNEGTLALLRYGFSLYRTATPVTDGERLASSALSYRDERLPLAASKHVRFTVRKGQDIETRVVSARTEVDSAARGERLGGAVVTLDGEVQARVPLVAARTVGGPSVGDRLDSALPGSRTAAWLIAAAAVGALVALVLGAAVALGHRRGGR